MDQSLVNLPAQYSKRKNEFDTAIASLQKAREIQSPAIAEKMVIACYSRKYEAYDIANRKDYNEVLELLSRWRVSVGQIKDIPAAQLKMETEFLIQNYPELTTTDVQVMIELLTRGLLDLKLDYVNFSALFMGRVINAYFNYKAGVISLVNEKVDRILPQQEDRTTVQRVEDMKGLISECHKHYKEGFKENFFNGTVYEFLRLTKRIVITKELSEKAHAHATFAYSSRRDNKNRSIAELSKPTDEMVDIKKSAIRQLCIDFHLKHFFDNNKLPDALKMVLAENFVQKES